MFESTTLFPIYSLRKGIPAVSVDQMREIDRLMEKKYGIELIQMMENAGRNLAHLVRKLLGGVVMAKRIVVVTGKGNNGAGGMVAARHLHNWGANVTVLARTKKPTGVPGEQWKTLGKLDVSLICEEEALEYHILSDTAAVIDAMIGYGLKGEVKGWVSFMVNKINGMPIVSLDIPSGFDADSGEACTSCVHADATLTLGLPKTGLLQADVEDITGTLYLADIGVPRELYKEIGLEVEPIFLQDSIVQLSGSRWR